MAFVYFYAGQSYQRCCDHPVADHENAEGRCMGAKGIARCECTSIPGGHEHELAEGKCMEPGCSYRDESYGLLTYNPADPFEGV